MQRFTEAHKYFYTIRRKEKVFPQLFVEIGSWKYKEEKILQLAVFPEFEEPGKIEAPTGEFYIAYFVERLDSWVRLSPQISVHASSIEASILLLKTKLKEAGYSE